MQGLFLKRQGEVAIVWTGIVTKEILTVQRLMDHMVNGPRAARTRALIRKHMKPLVDEVVGVVRPAAQLAVGIEGFADLKFSVGDKAVELSGRPFESRSFNEERAGVVEGLLRERMEALPPEEFQDLLRPCFQEEEIKLIAVGAILGFCAGVAQLILIFGDRLAGG